MKSVCDGIFFNVVNEKEKCCLIKDWGGRSAVC